MAVADARLTSVTGVVMVSRGPGASNVSIAIHTAQQDGVPLVVIVGQVERRNIGRSAFQEVDYATSFSGLAKAAFQINSADAVPALMAKAFHLARCGLPGPVIVAIPEDVFDERFEGERAPVFAVAKPRVAEADVSLAASLLGSQARPLFIPGMALNNDHGRKAVERFADAWQIPVAPSARQPDIIANEHPSFVAHLGYGTDPKLLVGLRQATAILAVGTRLGDVTSQGYTFPAAPHMDVPLIHIHESAEAISSARETQLPILADCAEFLVELAARAPAALPWQDWQRALRRNYEEWSRWKCVAADDGVVFGVVVDAVQKHAPHNSIITADAGNFGAWLNRYFRYRKGQKFLNALSGAMGFGVPAAVAAALRFRERRTICFVGDGGFLMTGTECATARAYLANPIIIVSDNGSYGTIRMHQEKKFPKREYATRLVNPDFAQLARSFGFESLTVTKNEEAEPAFLEALASKSPFLIHVRTSLKHISPSLTLRDD
jgi:acetolactate synthase-1/2/3 large subunit